MSTNTKVWRLTMRCTPRRWINDVAREFDTEDREFAYGVFRAWLRTLRDRLTVEASAHFAAQLPDLIRGVFYAGGIPRRPREVRRADLPVRFAREASVSPDDVDKPVAATTRPFSTTSRPARLTGPRSAPRRNPRPAAARALNLQLATYLQTTPL